MVKHSNMAKRELKARLTKAAKEAGRATGTLPIAEVDPLFAQGIAEGWITPPTGDGLQPVVPKPSSRSIAEVLDEDRG